MQKKLTHNIIMKSLLSCLMLALFAFQIVTRTIYSHSHKLHNGQIIHHSHPYNKANDAEPFKTHSHTQTEIFFIGQLGNLLLTFVLTLCLVVVCKEVSFKKYYFKITVTGSLITHQGRAPPLSS